MYFFSFRVEKFGKRPFSEEIFFPLEMGRLDFYLNREF
jgi:hypothetical protein